MSDSKEAYISFVHASKGASPGWGGGSRLVNIIGRQHALQLLATSLKISPKKGLEIGLIDLIASEEDICTEEVRSYLHYLSFTHFISLFLFSFLFIVSFYFILFCFIFFIFSFFI